MDVEIWEKALAMTILQKRRMKIPLSMTWGLLSRNSQRLVIDMYCADRRSGWSIDDARYFANAKIDQLRDIEKF
jgi:hypothetical protein